MSRRLPPLSALRSFEAAARLLSFTKAAAELNVTQAAVSHQIKSLEEWLGLKLFRRAHRALYLTDAGQSYLPVVREAFAKLVEGTERLTSLDQAGPLTVSVLPSFAAKWLVPRLPRFRRVNPEIDVRIDAAVRLVDFAREQVDVAIRNGLGGWPGVHAEKLMSEDVVPVCSPALVNGTPPLHRPGDLARHVLLHDDGAITWQIWLQAAGVEGVDWRRGPLFNDSGMLVQAAVDGQGVALARTALAEADLKAGRLVMPFDFKLPSSFAYYIVYPPQHGSRPKVQAFRAWLISEVQETSA
jgi:LysR family transcriptional regulator, glycine cleavage system transcriptional activator